MSWAVEQVEVEPLREANLEPDRDIVINSWPETLSTGEMVIKKYFQERLSVTQIAQQLNISKQYAHKTIHKAKQIMAEAIKKMGKIG